MRCCQATHQEVGGAQAVHLPGPAGRGRDEGRAGDGREGVEVPSQQRTGGRKGYISPLARS